MTELDPKALRAAHQAYRDGILIFERGSVVTPDYVADAIQGYLRVLGERPSSLSGVIKATEDELRPLIAKAIKENTDHTAPWYAADQVLNAIRPYIHDTSPFEAYDAGDEAS